MKNMLLHYIPKIVGDVNLNGIRANYELYNEKDELLLTLKKLKNLIYLRYLVLNLFLKL